MVVVGEGVDVRREGKTLTCFQFVGERLSRTPDSAIQLEEPTGLQIELRL